MAERFYLPSTGAAAVSPAYGAWGNVIVADRRAMVTTRISSAMTNQDAFTSDLLENASYLWRQYVSAPIPAQTITGTIKGQVRCSETDATDNHDRVTIRVIVVSNDGGTVRGTLLALGYYGNTNEYSIAPTLTSRKIADGDALSSVVAQANDRIVVEIGTQNSVLSIFEDEPLSAVFGDDSGTDLPEDETTTATNNPWVEFSQNLFNQTLTPSAVASAGAVLAGALIAGVLAVGCVGQASGPNSVKYSVAPAESAGAVVVPSSAAVVADSYNPTQATSVAEGISTFIMRAISTMGDSRDDTGAASVTPASWPTGAGTLTFAQNISGANLPNFAISHVIFGARGVMTQDGSYLSNLRFTVTGGSYPLIYGAWDDIRPYTLGSGSYSARCKDSRSDPATTKPGGGAWTWADVQALAGSAIKIDYSNITTVGHFADVWVSEMYVEAYGPQGSYIVPLTKRLKAGNLKRQFNIAETFNL